LIAWLSIAGGEWYFSDSPNQFLTLMPTFSPDTGDFITREEGRDGIAAYVASDAYDDNGGIKAHAFGLNKLRELTNQTNCAGVRLWYGRDTNNRAQLYMVAIDGNGDDILTTGNELVLDMSLPCPSYCPTTTSLES
jgi:hypothetical protein